MVGNRKFWCAVGAVGVQLVMFLCLLFTGFKFDAVVIGTFVAGPVATFTAFGIANVAAKKTGV